MEGFDWDSLRGLEQKQKKRKRKNRGEEASQKRRRLHALKAEKSTVAGISPLSPSLPLGGSPFMFLRLIVDTGSGSLDEGMKSNDPSEFYTRPGYAIPLSLPNLAEETDSVEFDLGEFVHLEKFE